MTYRRLKLVPALLIALLFCARHEALAQSTCTYYGGYPWRDNGCLIARDLNNAFAKAYEPPSVLAPGTAAANLGPAQGDVSGNWTSTKVTAIQGFNWATTAPLAGQVPIWDATNSRWLPSAPASLGAAAGDLSGTWPNIKVLGIQNEAWSSVAPTQNQVPFWNDTTKQWVPTTPTINAGQVSGLGTMATQNFSAVAITGGAITGMASPTAPSDVATRGYVDLVATTGQRVQGAVKYATTAPLPNAPAYANGTAGVGATLTATTNGALVVDGSNPIAGDRVLVKDQASAASNGPYVVTNPGGASATWLLTRATDWDQSAEMLSGSTFFVNSGSTNPSSSWTLATTGAITVGTTALTFNQSSSSLTYAAGAGLGLAGNVFSILTTGVTAGTYGSASQIPIFQLNARGQVISASAVTIPTGATGPAGGDLNGTFPNPGVWNVSAASFSTGASTGDSGIEVGGNRTSGSGNSYIDLHSTGGNATSDYDTRMVRGPGPTGNFTIQNAGTGLFAFQTNGITAAYFDSAQILTLAHPIPTTSGGTGRTAPIMDMMTDYTPPLAWTPGDASGSGLTFTSVSAARYMKIGKLCIVSASITWPNAAKGDLTLAKIGNLPCTSYNSGAPVGGGAISSINGAVSSIAILSVGNNSNVIQGIQGSGAGSFTNDSLANVTLSFTITYITG